MENLVEYINANVHLAPFIQCGLLLLAGFNLPVSEDLMIFIAAMLAAKNPDQMVPLFMGVYAGAYFSDVICYGLGRKLGPKLWDIKFFAKMVSVEKVDQVNQFYARYGVITLILGRFIPFGVRNALFLTAGLGKMPVAKFCLSDLLACTISNLVMFSLIYNYGESVMEIIKKGNIVIFSIAVVVGLGFFIKNKKSKKNEPESSSQ